jgi:hypothetical protein
VKKKTKEKKCKKRESNALWITIVMHSAIGMDEQ